MVSITLSVGFYNDFRSVCDSWRICFPFSLRSVRTIAIILALVLLVPFAAAQWKTDHVSPFVASSLVPPVTISRHTLPSIDVGYSLYDLRGFIDDCICNLLYQYWFWISATSRFDIDNSLYGFYFILSLPAVRTFCATVRIWNRICFSIVLCWFNVLSRILVGDDPDTPWHSGISE